MTKASYKILISDGISPDLRIIINNALSKNFEIISPKTAENAVNILSSGTVHLVLMEAKGYRAMADKIVNIKECINPNLIKILILSPKEAQSLRYLEELKSIHHIVETPISPKELFLTVKMALKTYDILTENNKLLDKLNQKALSLSIEQKRLSYALESLKEANLSSIRVLSEAIEAKDPYTRGHCQRVARLAKAIASHLGYSERMMEILELGAFLHDIGKIGIRGAVLNKSGSLTIDEKNHVKMHALIGENIVKGARWCKKFVHIIKHHHEMLDGSGYPDGLKGESIPLDARILGIADAFDAMTSQRPYREALPLEEALRRLKQGEGTQFDPKLLKIFLENKIYQKDLSDLKGINFKAEGNTKTKDS